MVVDPPEHVAEPGLRVDAVELGGLDQRVDRGRALAAPVRTAEGPVAASDRNTAQATLGGIVGHADPSVLDEVGERGPALQHVVHGPGHVGVAREPNTFGAHPRLKIGDERRDVDLPLRQALDGGNAVQRPLGLKDSVDPAHRLDRHGRPVGVPAWAALAMSASSNSLRRPCAQHAALGDRPGSSVGRIEIAVAAIGIGLEDPGIGRQVPLQVLAGPVARVEEHGCRRILAPERPIVPDVTPQPARRGLALGQHRHGRVVAVDPLGDQNVAFGGTVSLIGFFEEGDRVGASQILFSGARLQPIMVGSTASFDRMNRALEMIQIRPVIDRVYPFEAMLEALAHLGRGPFGKVVIRVAP